MAKFTAGVDLNLEWQGHKFVGVAGTTHRLTDALVEEFTEEVSGVIPGFAWVSQDELTSVVTLPIGQNDVTGLTAALASKLTSPIAQTDVTGLTAALDGKYDKTGGTISGAVTVTGTLGVQGAATLSSTLVVTGAGTVAGALRAGAGFTAIGAATMSDTLGVVGAASFNTTITVAGKATFSSSLKPGGTSFPGSPTTDDVFYRTDHGRWYYYNGSNWLSVEQFQLGPLILFTAQPYSATAAQSQRAPVPSTNGGSDIYIEDVKTAFNVASGGSALSGSHKWVATLEKWDSSGGTTISSSVNPIDSGSSAVWRSVSTDIDALVGAYAGLFVTWTKTGTPGNLNAYMTITYRIVAT